MTTNHPTPGDELVERAKEIAIAAYERLRPVGGKFWRELDDMTQTLAIVAARDALRTRDEAARSSTTEVEQLSIPVLDPVYAEEHPLLAPIIAKRAQAAGNFSPEFSGQHGEDFDRGLLCAFEAVNAELQRLTALQSKDHSHAD